MTCTRDKGKERIWEQMNAPLRLFVLFFFVISTFVVVRHSQMCLVVNLRG